MLDIERCDVDDVLNSFLRHILEHQVSSLAVRVDEAHPFAVLNVLNSHILKHGGFSHACLSNNVDMPSSILGFDAELHPLVASVGLREICDAIFVHRSNSTIEPYYNLKIQIIKQLNRSILNLCRHCII